MFREPWPQNIVYNFTLVISVVVKTWDSTKLWTDVKLSFITHRRHVIHVITIHYLVVLFVSFPESMEHKQSLLPSLCFSLSSFYRDRITRWNHILKSDVSWLSQDFLSKSGFVCSSGQDTVTQDEGPLHVVIPENFWVVSFFRGDKSVSRSTFENR